MAVLAAIGKFAFSIASIVHTIAGGRQRAAAIVLLMACALPGAAQANCWEASAAKYGIDPFLLAAIARVESSFNPKAYAVNKDGTEDIGIMQINTKVLREVKHFGITREQLFEPCINIDVAAWKLASHFRDYGITWYAVGAYHSKTPTFNRVYQLKVYLAFLNLTGRTQMRTAN